MEFCEVSRVHAATIFLGPSEGSHRPTVKPLEIGGGSLKRNYSFFLPIAGRSAVVGGTMRLAR
jgi:hypothetical protein